ncbi:MAG: DUF58 domain-containing protein [Gammaproteobacteria bacterium]|nr:DUF58 domain-containing protein [Gammaproteobacteria bacterium]
MAVQISQRWFQKRFRDWQNRRLPPVKQVRLTQRQVFIFLSREGGLYAFMMLAIFIAGINYANNLVLGLCFFLGSVLVVVMHHTFNNLSGLLLEAVDASDCEAGTYTNYRIRITPKGRQIACQIKLEWDDQILTIPVLDRATLITMQLKTPTRGKFLPPRLSVSTVYPLGILRAWTYVRFNEPAWVSPQPIEGILNGQRTLSDDDDESVLRVAGQDEFDDLRSFIEGESLAHVSWGHLARGQGMMTKRFSDPCGREQLLDYDAMHGGHELRLSQLAYWVKRLTEEHVSFELKVRQQSLSIGQGLLHQKAALRLLAEVE